MISKPRDIKNRPIAEYVDCFVVSDLRSLAKYSFEMPVPIVSKLEPTFEEQVDQALKTKGFTFTSYDQKIKFLDSRGVLVHHPDFKVLTIDGESICQWDLRSEVSRSGNTFTVTQRFQIL